MEKVKPDLILVEFHLVNSRLELISLFLNHFLTLLYFLLLLLELLDFFVNLLFHHLKQVLMLDLKLIHNSTEALFQLVDFFIELLSYLHFKLVVEFLVDHD